MLLSTPQKALLTLLASEAELRPKQKDEKGLKKESEIWALDRTGPGARRGLGQGEALAQNNQSSINESRNKQRLAERNAALTYARFAGRGG